jgi:molecular chaperone DnaK (HSP70)
MAKKINLNKELVRISLDLEDALREVIVKEGLVDTGKLRDSVSVEVTDNEITISTEDYYKYLDNDYRLTQQFENSPAFNNAIKRLEQGLTDNIENNLEQ